MDTRSSERLSLSLPHRTRRGYTGFQRSTLRPETTMGPRRINDLRGPTFLSVGRSAAGAEALDGGGRHVGAELDDLLADLQAFSLVEMEAVDVVETYGLPLR